MLKPNQRSIHKVFSSDKSVDLINYLKEEMVFNDDLRLIIPIGMAHLASVSSLINYNQPIQRDIKKKKNLFLKMEKLIK